MQNRPWTRHSEKKKKNKNKEECKASSAIVYQQDIFDQFILVERYC